MANNTGNPVGSTAAKDLSDNAENLDKFANGGDYEYADRLGRPRKSLKWIEDAALAIPAIDAAQRSEQQAERAVVAKSEAEAARDAAQLSSGVYVDTTEGLEKTPDGRFFSVPSPGSSDYLVLYRNNAGVAVEQDSYPNAAAVHRVGADIFDQRLTLTKNGMAFYRGSGPIHPIMIDAVNRLLLGFDSGSSKLVGPGIMTQADVMKDLALKRTAEFKGTGPIHPLLTDSSNRVLLGYNATTGKIIGAGLGDGGSAGESYQPLRAVPLPFEMRPVSKAVNHYLFYGQSLATGATATTLLSTTQPYSNITFAGGPRGNGNLAAFKPLVEDAISPAPDGGTNRGETPCSGAANFATLHAAERLGAKPGEHVILASTAAHGGYRISLLIKGSAWYQQIIDQVTAAKANNSNYAVHVIGWLQGENDAVTGGVQTPYAAYRAALEKLQIDLEEDIKAVTGQITPVFMVTYQLTYGAATWPDIAKAHLDLAQNNPKFFLSTPMYQFPYAPDQVHLTSVGYKWTGAYFGRAYERLVREGVEPQWVSPLSAVRTGNTIRVRFSVPVPPLKVDSIKLAATTDGGFRVKDSVGTVGISSVAVENGSEVVIALASIPIGDTTVRYALDYLGAGLAITGGASGNLRDSDRSSVLIDGVERPMFNLCPHFELPVILNGGI